MRTVRGFDLSSSSTGICHPDGTTEVIAPKGDMLARCQHIRDRIAEWDTADVSVFEAIGTRHVNTAIAMATVHALVLDNYTAHQLLLDNYTMRLTTIVKVPPTQLKKWATGKGAGKGTDKVGMTRAAQTAGWVAPPEAGDDEADAWWLWTLGMAMVGDWQVPETLYRQTVLDALVEG